MGTKGSSDLGFGAANLFRVVRKVGFFHEEACKNSC